MAVNKVILVGNVGKDPEVRYLEKDVAVANFTIATTERGFTSKTGQQIPDRTEWHNIVAWRGLATIIEKYVKKGSQLFIEGKLRTRQWDDKDGNKRYTTEIFADNIQLLGKKTDNPGSFSPEAAAPSQPSQQPTSVPPSPSNTDTGKDNFLGGDETDDLPF